MPQIVRSSRELRCCLFRREGGYARCPPDVAIDLVAQQPAPLGAEQPPSGAVPNSLRWLFRISVSGGGIGTTRTSPFARCLS